MSLTLSCTYAATLRRLLLLTVFCLFVVGLRAQPPGELDTSFNAVAGITNGKVYSIVPIADGKVLIGGDFTSVGGVVRNRLARLNANGSVDESFNPGSGANSTVYSLAVQSDGKVLVGGAFTSLNGSTRNRMARLKNDGSLDTAFDPGAGADYWVSSIVVQSDGKVLIGGHFTSFNGTARNRIARLNADGSLDTTFDSGTGVREPVSSIAVQSDGKVLMGGSFSQINGIARRGIARLNADGSLDTSFNPGTGANGVETLAVQSDGKVLIGGEFTSVGNMPRNRIARFNADGSLDTSFNPGANSPVQCLAVQSDGKVLIGGEFTSVGNIPRNRIARLNADGSLDTSFDVVSGSSGRIYALAVQSDGKVLIGGWFIRFNSTARNSIARLNADGSLDNGFNSGTGTDGTVYALAVQGDGRVLIGGDFTSFAANDDAPFNHIARFNTDGSLDTSFEPGAGIDQNRVSYLAVQRDGKVLIAGFTSFNGPAHRGIARLNADGSLDTSFNSGTGADYVDALAVQSDGKVLIGGQFSSFNGTVRKGVARLNGDGSLDTSFDPGTGTDGTVDALAVQSDGKVLIGGYFTSFNGTARSNIARLNADGSLDTGFNPGTGANSTVSSIIVQSHGKVLIGGSFTSFNGTARNDVARLNADGSLDTSFDPGAGANGSVQSVAVQSNGKMLIGGDFTSFNGTARNCIARLNADGSLDASFDPGLGANRTVRSIAVQVDGKVLIGGWFTSFDGTARGFLVRLQNDAATQELTVPSTSRVQWLRGGASPETQDVSFDLATDGGTIWTPLGIGTRIRGGWELAGLTLPDSGTVRARARTTGGYQNGSSGIVETVQAYSPASAPTATSGAAANITRTSADLSGVVNPNGAETAVLFQTRKVTESYTVASSVPAVQSPVPSGTEPMAVSATKTGLQPGTTYEFTIASSNSVGAGATSQSVSFTTLPNAAPVADERQLEAPLIGVPTTIFDVTQHASDADGDVLSVSILDGAAANGSVSTDGQTVMFNSTGLVGRVSVQLQVSDGFSTTPVRVVMSNMVPATSKFAAKDGAVPEAGEDPRIPEGSVWSSFGVPSINDSGAVAFLGNVTSSSTSFSGIFAGEQSAPVLVARKGDAAPGTGGALFASFRDPLLSNAGEVVIIATLSGPGVSPKNRQGLWKATPVEGGGYTLELLARTGDEPSGVAGALWKSFVSVQLHGEPADPSTRSVVALAALAAGPGRVTSANDLGLWRFDESGTRLLLREGQSLDARGVTSKVKILTALSAVPGSPGHGRVSAAQGALIRVKLSDGRDALLQADGESLAVLAATGDEIEAGVLVAKLGIPGGDLAGFTKAKVTLTGPGVAAASKTAIARFSAKEPAGLIYRTDVDSLPAGFPQIKIFGDPVANSSGSAFLATLTGEGVKNGTNTALVWRESGNLTLVAREGAEPIGVPGAQWASFTSVALPEERGPLFTAKLRIGRGGVSRVNDVGLWAVDSAGTLHLIAREGALIEGKTLRKFTILSAVAGSPAQGRSYNAKGALIYRAYFTDGSQVLIRVQLP